MFYGKGESEKYRLNALLVDIADEAAIQCHSSLPRVLVCQLLANMKVRLLPPIKNIKREVNLLVRF